MRLIENQIKLNFLDCHLPYKKERESLGGSFLKAISTHHCHGLLLLPLSFFTIIYLNSLLSPFLSLPLIKF